MQALLAEVQVVIDMDTAVDTGMVTIVATGTDTTVVPRQVIVRVIALASIITTIRTATVKMA